ncbi:hypothetical protein [Streptomyces sp. NPDC048172]|uniref:hypothetical protein n=1 Tax=Streptomyces sp. NPDC048172 TaxID=3365505 RepID=UPI00371EB7AC
MDVRDERAEALRTLLIDLVTVVRPEAAAMTVTDECTLTGDIALDSVQLAEFFDRIRAEIGDVDFTFWMSGATQADGDTLGSLIQYLVTVAPDEQSVAESVREGVR